MVTRRSVEDLLRPRGEETASGVVRMLEAHLESLGYDADPVSVRWRVLCIECEPNEELYGGRCDVPPWSRRS